MLELNLALFLLLNAPAHPPGWMVGAAAALANSPVAVAPGLVAALWVWGAPSGRGALVAVAGAVHDAALRTPALTSTTLAPKLGVAPQTATALLRGLFQAGVVREITGRKHFRAWAA